MMVVEETVKNAKRLKPPKIYNVVSLSSKRDEKDISELVYKITEALRSVLEPGMSHAEQEVVIKQFAREGALQSSKIGQDSVKLFTEVMDEMGTLSKDTLNSVVFDTDRLSTFKYIDSFKIEDHYTFDDVLNKSDLLVNDNARASYRETVQIGGEDIELEDGDRVLQRHKAAPGACDFCCSLEMWSADTILPHTDCRCGVEQYIANSKGYPVYMTEDSDTMKAFYKKMDEE